MPRPPRFDVPGFPYHVIQRGVNRASCFFGDVDRRYYLKLLAKFAETRRCAVHAYVLMTNHVHLLLTPAAKGAVAALMQDLGRSYVRVINAIHGRTGTLWQGRFKSSVVDSERYFLACQRYIEMNPVRAGIVSHPNEYAWSSYAHYANGAIKPFITEHDCFARLGTTSEGRAAAYRGLFVQGMSSTELQAIRLAANSSAALGEEGFIERLSVSVGRNIGPRRRGRPINRLPDPSLIPVPDKLL